MVKLPKCSGGLDKRWCNHSDITASSALNDIFGPLLLRAKTDSWVSSKVRVDCFKIRHCIAGHWCANAYEAVHMADVRIASQSPVTHAGTDVVM